MDTQAKMNLAFWLVTALGAFLLWRGMGTGNVGPGWVVIAAAFAIAIGSWFVPPRSEQ